MLLAPVFGQLPFDGGFEEGGFVAFEVGLGALERRDGFVEAGELLFDLPSATQRRVFWRRRRSSEESRSVASEPA